MDKNQRKEFFKTTLPTLKPVEIIEHEITEQRFISIFNQVHGDSGEMAYEKEKFYFQKILIENPEIAKCTPLSLFSVFLDVATKGLSLDNSSKPLCYITFRNAKVIKPGSKDPVWERRAILDISGYGELILRIRAKQLSYADNPEIVYVGEEFSKKVTKNGVEIEHNMKYPRPQQAGILLIYVRIVRPNGEVTFADIDKEGIDRLKEYSAMNNGKWVKDDDGKYVNVPGDPNKLYEDVGFLKAKCLKHAFQSFPKLKLNNYSAFSNEGEDPKELGITYEQASEALNVASNIEPIVETQVETEEPAGVVIEDNDTF